MNKVYINSLLNIAAMLFVIASSLVSNRGIDFIAIGALVILVLSIISIINEYRKKPK